MDSNRSIDEKSESRLYVGNLDLRVTEGALIKLFSPFGKIVSEDFLCHTRGPNRGEPRGFTFIQYSNKEEAMLAEEKMHGRLAWGRPLIVHLASEKYAMENIENPLKPAGLTNRTCTTIGCSSSGLVNKSAKIAKISIIKSKLKTLEEERSCAKKPRPS